MSENVARFGRSSSAGSSSPKRRSALLLEAVLFWLLLELVPMLLLLLVLCLRYCFSFQLRATSSNLRRVLPDAAFRCFLVVVAARAPSSLRASEASEAPIDDYAWLIEHVLHPPWVGMRAARCVSAIVTIVASGEQALIASATYFVINVVFPAPPAPNPTALSGRVPGLRVVACQALSGRMPGP